MQHRVGKYTAFTVAHRGYWDIEGVTENSLASLQKAAELGCWGSEFDVHLTRDGEVVVHHNDHIGDTKLQFVDYEVLKDYRLSNGEILPTLRDYLKEARKYKRLQLVLEVKNHYNKEREDACVDRVLQLVDSLGLRKRTHYISFSMNICERLALLSPGSNIAYLNGDRAPHELLPLGINGIDYERNVLRNHPEWIDEAHKLGMTVNVWTVNDEEIDYFVQRNVDFITTNTPQLGPNNKK